MDRRYAVLLARACARSSADGDFGLHVVAIDELAFYMRGGTKDERTELSETLRDLISRGRAAGMIVVAATQKPSNDIVPTFVRDLFSFRMALRCTTPEASDTILGQGWAKEGYSASTLDPTPRGVGCLLAEGAVPVKVRTHYLDDDAIAELAQRAAATEGGGELGRPLASGAGRGRPGRPVLAPGPPARRHLGPRDGGARRGRTCSSPCKDRRAAVCPSCSRLYQADAWQLVAAGIRGGKGVSPARGRAPPALRHPDRAVVRAGARAPRLVKGLGPCRPRRSAGLCTHGRPLCQRPRRSPHRRP